MEARQERLSRPEARVLLSASRWLLFGAVLFARPALADEAPSKAECLDAYTRSQPLRRDGKLSEARKALLICARDPCPKQLQPDCVGWLDEVANAIPSIVLGAKDAAGRDLTRVQVLIDGRSLASELDGRALEIDPGSHVLRFESEGRHVEQTLVVREGDKQRRVNVTFPTAKPHVSRQPRPEADVASTGPAPLAWVLGGVGVVALGSFAYFGATGVADRSRLESCKPNCATDDVTSVNRKFWIANVSLAIAAVSLGAATYLFVSSSKTQPATVGFVTRY